MHVEPTVSSAPTAPAPPTQPPVLNTATLQPAAPEGPPSVSPINLLGSGSTTSPLPIGLGPATSTTHIGTVSPAAHSIPAGPHAISTGVSAGLLLAPIQPLYPAIARAAHQQGTVTVEALISTTGRIEAAHAIAGPVMLQGAAVDAVRNARYHPFLLNGQPTEVNATFSIHFTLNE
jgi:protein TonB